MLQDLKTIVGADQAIEQGLGRLEFIVHLHCQALLEGVLGAVGLYLTTALSDFKLRDDLS